PAIVSPVLIAPSQLVVAAPKVTLDPEMERRLRRIEEDMARLARLPQRAVTSGSPVVPEGSPVVLEDRPPAQAPRRQPVDVAAIALLFRNRCAECHTSPGRDGVHLFDTNGAFDPNVSRREIERAVRSDRMPRGKPVKLNAAEKALVRAWAEEER
ncbi:MAG: hypothetical protein KGL39_40220, partial [Patescibacteria group bacterium]|nr:hypothetical protein [Patescibacteria group bacterium]